MAMTITVTAETYTLRKQRESLSARGRTKLVSRAPEQRPTLIA